MRQTLQITLCAALALSLSGCGYIHFGKNSLQRSASSADFQSNPVGVGSGPDKLKRAPCACAKIPQKKGLPEWLNAPAKPATAPVTQGETA